MRSLPTYSPFNIKDIDPYNIIPSLQSADVNPIAVYNRAAEQQMELDAAIEKNDLKKKAKEVTRAGAEKGQSEEEILKELKSYYLDNGYLDEAMQVSSTLESQGISKKKRKAESLKQAEDLAQYNVEEAFRRYQIEDPEGAALLKGPESLLGVRQVFDPKQGAMVRQYPNGRTEVVSLPKRQSGGGEGKKKLRNLFGPDGDKVPVLATSDEDLFSQAQKLGLNLNPPEKGMGFSEQQAFLAEAKMLANKIVSGEPISLEGLDPRLVREAKAIAAKTQKSPVILGSISRPRPTPTPVPGVSKGFSQPLLR